MNVIAQFTEYCVRKDIISSSDAEWFSYGLVQRSEKLIAICFLFPLGCLLSSFSTSLVFYLSFFLLRTHTNGYHAKTSAGCLLFSICSECVLFLLIFNSIRAASICMVVVTAVFGIFNYELTLFRSMSFIASDIYSFVTAVSVANTYQVQIDVDTAEFFMMALVLVALLLKLDKPYYRYQ